jgi:hypothetical protein
LSEAPGGIGQRDAAGADRAGLGIRRIAGLGAGEHAFQDHGQAEQRKRQMERLQRFAHPAAGGVGRDIFGLVRQAERCHVEIGQPVVRGGRDIGDAIIGEVGQGMAERRQLPIQQPDHPRLGRVEHHIVEPEIAMAQADLVASRNMVRQPLGEPVDRRVGTGLRALPLPGPACDLALEIIAGLAIVAKVLGRPIDPVQPGQRVCHAKVDRSSFCRRQRRQGRRPEDAAAQALHHIERRADDGRILAIE